MARDVITLGEVASRTAAIELLCSRCERRGRLNTARLLTEHGPRAAMGEVVRAQIGDCPHCPDLARLFGRPDEGWTPLSAG